MAAARSLLAASRSHVPSERSQPGRRRTPGQVQGAEPDGGRGGASMVTQLQRADTLHPPAVEDDLMATLRWPEPSAQPGPLQGGPYEAWSDHMQRPDSPGKACSYPVWTTGEEAKDEDSLVSSGRLSGSSGGHESCAPPHGPWKERAPQVLGSPRLPRQSNPRLEQLRDKIRAQVQWQASCASLATSTPSSASHLYKASSPAPRRKTRKLKHSPPAPASPGSRVLSAAERGVEDKVLPGHGREPFPVSLCQASVPREKTKSTKNSSYRRETAPKSPTPQRATRDTDSELVGVHAWRKGAALARELLGPPPARPRLQSEASPRGLAPSAELGPAAAATACDDEAGAPESTPVRARTPSPASVRGDLHMPASTPHSASCDQHVTIQSAMAILRELRQQIQTGLELARDRHVRGGHEHRLRDLTGRGHQGPWSVPAVRGSSSSPRATTEGPRSTWERAGAFPSRPRWSTLARWESYPQRAWSAQARDSSFQRPGSPHERPAPFPLRPWSALAGQRTQATCEEWGGPAGASWNSLERRSSSTQRPWSSASFTQRAGIPCKSRGSLLPLSGAKHSWPRPAQAAPRNAPGKENEARRPPPCPKPRGFLGHPYSSESLREFMRQKARARRQQALEEKAAALQAVELRSQRLRDVHRKQREAVLGKAASGKVVPKKAFPVVSQTNPGIVTFVPHSAQCRGLEAPGSLGSPVLQWSKVTSGMVLGDQEAPGSFCLCLNRALNHAETLDTGAPQEGWDGAPLLTSAGSSQGPLRLRDLSVPTRSQRPGLCIYLDPEEAERLGTPGPLHFRYKHARLQALETMANILKQRIDTLTAKLLQSETADTLGDLGLDRPPSCPSTAPAAPARSGALVPNGGGGAPWGWADARAGTLLSPTCLLDGETPLWSSAWEPWQSVSPSSPLASKPPGFMEDGCSELDRRLARNVASFRALSPFTGSSHGVPIPPDPTCCSLWLEETPSARGAGLVTPWTTQSCGQREPGGLRSGRLADIQQQSLSFLQSLKLDQRRQGQALARLRQRAEVEVREAEKALDGLLFQHQLERLMEKHSTQARSEVAGELARLQVCGDPDPKTSWSMVTARPRSHLPPGRDAAVFSWGRQEGRESQEGKPASAEATQEGRPDWTFSQLPLARLYPWENPTHQMLEQSLREEELRAQHQAALLRLRQKALAEKVHAERAWLEHQRRCLGSTGNGAALAALEKQQQQTFSNLEQEQREIQYLWNSHLCWHQERTRLLQHHRDALSVQRALARRQQELQTWTLLPQSSSPGVKAAQEGGSEASQRSEGRARGSSCPPTPRGPGSPASPASQRPRERPEGLRAPCLLTGQQDGTSPRAPSPADGHLQPPRLAWEEDTPSADGWPDAQGQPLESSSNMDQGDPQAKPSPSSAEGETPALTESQACSFQARSWHSGDGADPCGPQEASVSSSTSRAGAAPGLGSANSLVRKPPEMESWRTGTHWQGDTCALFPWQEAARQTARPAPAAAEEVVPHTPHQGSPLPQRSAPAALGSPSVSAPRTCSGSPAGSRAPSCMSSLSCSSLPEFQKVSAILVQLSESSVSLSDWEAGDSPDAELPGPRESSPRGAWERPGGSRASPLSGLSAVSGGLESAVPGLMRTGWQPPLGDVPTSRSVSEVSSGIWDEEGLPEPSASAQPTLGRPSPTGGSSDLHSGRAPCPARPALGPGEGQEASGTSESLTSGSDIGKATRMSPEAACVASTSEISSSSDSNLSLSFPLASSTSEEAEFGEGGGTGPPLASAGRPRASSGADLGPTTNRKPPQASPVSLQAPPGDPSGLATLTAESQGPGCGGGRASPVWEEAHPALAGGVQPEILSPVDEVLSCGSADLPSCTHRDTPPPPPAPNPPAESGATPSPSSEDFPSLPEDAMSPGGSLGPPEEDTSINTGQLPSLLHLGDELGELSSVAGDQAVGSPWSEPVSWLGSPLCVGAGSALGGLPRLQSPTPSAGACVAAEGLPTQLMAGDTGLPGTGWGDRAPAVDMSPCADLPSMRRAEVVDLVSTQLTRRILCDTLAVLSELAQPGSQ